MEIISKEVALERKIDRELDGWKQRKDSKPLVLMGPRQVGKTTSVLAFGARAYESVVHIDFYRQPQMKAAFAGSLEPEVIVKTLEALLQRDIDPSTTLLFLDEIQDCDNAITSLKFFCSDAPQFDVIAAGSLLGVHVARKGSFPVGYVDMLDMHPMDFEEFCWALGEQRAFALLRANFESLGPFPLHEQLMSLYRDYLLVGGMPEAVRKFASERRVSEIAKVQHDIRIAYVADMVKYASSADAAKISACWESIPAQLAKESGSTKFMWRYVASGAKAERYGAAVDWLVASGIVSKCTQVSDGVAPLKSFENESSFKLYLADTGLLANAYDAVPSDFEDTGNRSARFRGGMAENYVMQQLVATGFTPYYWGMQSTYEVEFVVRLREGVVPVEVKSGVHVKSTSALKFADKYGCPYVLRVTAKNFGATDNVRNIPLYAACLIKELA